MVPAACDGSRALIKENILDNTAILSNRKCHTAFIPVKDQVEPVLFEFRNKLVEILLSKESQDQYIFLYHTLNLYISSSSILRSVG